MPVYQPKPRDRGGASRAIRNALAAGLAVPILGAIYVRTASRRLWTREVVLAAALIVGSALGLRFVADAGAHVPAASPSPAPAFQRVDVRALEMGLADGPLPSSAPSAAPAPPPAPVIVRFRPRDGGTGVLRGAQLSVRFSQPMDHATTQAAFHATIGDAGVPGVFRWAEGDTVLVFRPSARMPWGAEVSLAVDESAMSAAGAVIGTGATAVTFTVEPKPAVASTSAPRTAPSAWQWPLIGPITQYFGQTLTQYGFHQGIDIDGDLGDPVRAARSGTVVVAGYADACGGLQVRVDHGNGVLSWYRHLSKIKTTVGTRVTAGTIIGAVGATGCALGTHLHFGISVDGTFVDPLRYLPRR